MSQVHVDCLYRSCLGDRRKRRIEILISYFGSDIGKSGRAILVWNHTCDFKSNSPCALVQFYNHAYNFRPNCTPLSSITIINHTIFSEKPHRQRGCQYSILLQCWQKERITWEHYWHFIAEFYSFTFFHLSIKRGTRSL